MNVNEGRCGEYVIVISCPSDCVRSWCGHEVNPVTLDGTKRLTIVSATYQLSHNRA
jgi:hypothetical protein